MTLIDRRLVSAGWQPDVDAATAPPGAFLRADNLVLDEVGVLALRRDSARLFTLADLDVHTLHTEVLNGVRQRLAGAGNSVYLNGSLLQAGMTGAGDVAFGAALGQILFARGSSRFKFDGATVRTWGLAMTGAAPLGIQGVPDGKTFVTGASGAAPAFVINEDDGTGLTYQAAHDGTPAGATIVHPSATTGRGTMTAALAAPKDFTVYDNLTEGDDADLVAVYVYVSEPAHLASIDLLIDVNVGDFQTDYYLATFSTAQPVDVGATDTQGVNFDTQPATPTPVTAAVPGNLVSVILNVGWNKLQVTRGQLQRVGATSGKDWTTVKAVRVAVSAYNNDAVAFDGFRIAGGRLTGEYAWCYVLAYDTGNYVALSHPSEVSDPLTLASSAATVIIPLDGHRDAQAAQIWLFRKGGALPAFLRVAVQTIGPTSTTPAIFSYTAFWEAEYLEHLPGAVDNGPSNYVVDFEGTAFSLTVPQDEQFGPGVYTNTWEVLDTAQANKDYVAVTGMLETRGTVTGAINISDTLSDVNALIANIPLAADNDVPPANILDIEGPYFDRTFVLTADGFLWPSRQLNPDTFATGQAIRVTAPDEQAYWVKKGLGGLYVGTSKDIYRLEGDGTELPDGSINFTKRPLNVDHPPIADGLAQEGNLLVYLANDGWRAFNGETTTSIVGGTSLLYRGYTRHGVSPVNLTTGRFRAVLAKGQFLALTPEGADTTATGTLYRHVPSGVWYRHLYTPRFRTLHSERDGTILASDTAGGVWQLDTVNVSAIPVTLWTPADDAGQPFARKTATNLHLTFDSGGTALTVLALRDGAASGGVVFSAARTGLDLALLNAAAIGEFRQLQLQITGSVTTFRYAGFGLSVVPRPMGVLQWDTGPIVVAKGELAWIRRVFVKLRPSAPITVTVIVDGVSHSESSVTTPGGQDATVPVDFGRGVVGRTVRLLISSGSEFLPYSAEILLRSTGKGSDKSRLTVPAA